LPDIDGELRFAQGTDDAVPIRCAQHG
jgi:hypothetical protein